MQPVDGLTPEQRARVTIDRDLELAGWVIHNHPSINLHASQGAAVREAPTGDGGFADYLLDVDKRIVGVVEAKKAGVTLAEFHAQAMRYAGNLTAAQQLNAVGL